MNANDCTEIEARLYEPLLAAESADPEENESASDTADTETADELEEMNSTERKLREFIRRLNPDSLTVRRGYAETDIEKVSGGNLMAVWRKIVKCSELAD